MLNPDTARFISGVCLPVGRSLCAGLTVGMIGAWEKGGGATPTEV